MCGKKAVSRYAYEENGKIYAEIPPVMLHESGQLLAYLVLEMEGREEAVYCGYAIVHARPKPSDYVEPEEIETWHELADPISALEQSGMPTFDDSNAGQLVYIAADGVLTPLKMGPGLAIVDGVLVAPKSGGTVTARVENDVLICEMEE